MLTRKFSSDDVEGIFSAVRASQGYNDQANAVGSLYALETILKTGLFAPSLYGNSSDSNAETLTAACSRKNVTGRFMPTGRTIELSMEQKKLASLFGNPPGKRT